MARSRQAPGKKAPPPRSLDSGPKIAIWNRPNSRRAQHHRSQAPRHTPQHTPQHRTVPHRTTTHPLPRTPSPTNPPANSPRHCSGSPRQETPPNCTRRFRQEISHALSSAKLPDQPASIARPPDPPDSQFIHPPIPSRRVLCLNPRASTTFTATPTPSRPVCQLGAPVASSRPGLQPQPRAALARQTRASVDPVSQDVHYLTPLLVFLSSRRDSRTPILPPVPRQSCQYSMQPVLRMILVGRALPATMTAQGNRSPSRGLSHGRGM